MESITLDNFPSRLTTSRHYKPLYIVVCENNLGQFANYLRMTNPEYKYLQYNKVQGLPFTVIELEEHFEKLLEE